MGKIGTEYDVVGDHVKKVSSPQLSRSSVDQLARHTLHCRQPGRHIVIFVSNYHLMQFTLIRFSLI